MGVLTSLKKYRAIWGVAAIVSQYRAIWGHIILGVLGFFSMVLPKGPGDSDILSTAACSTYDIPMRPRL